MALTDKLTAIADAIRSKTRKTDALTLDQMPGEIAGIVTGGSGDGSSRVVENVVNIAVGVSVTSGKWYTHFLYNGVRLPRIPDNVLAEYPYAWIRNDGANGNYNLVFGKQPWYFDPEPSLGCGDKSSLPYYSIPISSYSTATEWTNQKYAGGTNFGLASNRTVLWSNHDIPNGSATATDIYFAGSEPVPTD